MKGWFKSVKASSKDVKLYVLIIVSLIVSLIVALKDTVKIDESSVLHFIFIKRDFTPDEQYLFYFIYDLWGYFFGTSDFVLRLLPISIFVLSLMIFYKFIQKNTDQAFLPLATCFLVLLDIYILDHNIYYFSYVFYFFFIVFNLSSFISLIKMPHDTRTQWLYVASLFGVFFHLYFYLIIFAQIFYFLMNDGKRILKRIKFAYMIISVHLVSSGMTSFMYRASLKENGRNEIDFTSILLNFLGYINFEGPRDSIQNWLMPFFIIKGIILVVCVMKIVFKRVNSPIEKYFFILLIISSFTYLLTYLLNLEEIEYRYFFYLTPLFMMIYMPVIFKARNYSRYSILFLLFFFHSMILYGFLSSKDLHGNNDVLISGFRELNNQFSGKIVFTDVYYYLDTNLLPLFVRKYPEEKIKFTYKDIKSFQYEKDFHGNSILFIFNSEEFYKSNLSKLFRNKVKSLDLHCELCDSDLDDVLIYTIN